MERLIILSIVTLLSAQEDESCPKTVSSWKEKEAAIHCGRDKYYHCLKNEKRKAVHTCLSRSWVQPGFCPEYNSVANEIDVFLCKENLGECPVATFWSNELYKFSACLNAVSADEVEDNIITTNGGVNGKEGSLGTPLIILIVCCSIALLMAVFTILWCVFKRKKEDTSAPREIELSPTKETRETCAKTDAVETTMPLITYQNDSISDTKISSRENNKGGTSTLQETELSPMEDDSNARLTSAKSDTLSIPINIIQHGTNDNSLTATTEVVKISSTEERQGAEKSKEVQFTNTNLTRAEQVESLIQRHLCEPGSRLLIIIPLQSDFSNIENALWKKEPGYLKIDNFDDWSKTSDKEGYYVLLSCITREFSLAGDLSSCKKDLIKIASDIEELKLKAVIPVRSDDFVNKKHNILRFRLFGNLKPMEI